MYRNLYNLQLLKLACIFYVRRRRSCIPKTSLSTPTTVASTVTSIPSTFAKTLSTFISTFTTVIWSPRPPSLFQPLASAMKSDFTLPPLAEPQYHLVWKVSLPLTLPPKLFPTSLHLPLVGMPFSGIKQIIVLGDSMLNIQKLHKDKELSEHDWLPLDLRIREQIKKFETVVFYHIRRENNKIADAQANIRACLEQGDLLLNQGDKSHHYIQ